MDQYSQLFRYAPCKHCCTNPTTASLHMLLHCNESCAVMAVKQIPTSWWNQCRQFLPTRNGWQYLVSMWSHVQTWCCRAITRGMPLTAVTASGLSSMPQTQVLAPICLTRHSGHTLANDVQPKKLCTKTPA